MRRTLCTLACALVVSAVALASAASAEPLEGRVVADTSGQPVPNIQVYLQSQSMPGLFFVQRSATDGRFVFAAPPPGLYTIRAVVANTPFKGFQGYLVPPGAPDGGIQGPIGLPLGMSSDVELRLTNPDSGGGGLPAPPFDGRLIVNVRRAVGRVDLPSSVIFSFDTPLGWEVVANQRVRITPVLPTAGAPFDRFTNPQGVIFEQGLAPLPPDGPPPTYAFDVALVDGAGVAGPATRVVDDAPGWSGVVNLLAPTRLSRLSGRVFVEHGVADGDFDPTDQPLPAREVRLFSGDDGLPPVATATTGPAGDYAFGDLVDGFYVVETDGRDGPERRALEWVLLGSTADPVVDLALSSDTCPRVGCGSGPLHEALFELGFPVGDPTAFALRATLHDGCGTTALRDAASAGWSGPFPGPVAGANGVLRVESVVVTDGWARVRVRATAQGTSFPGGFFGTPVRRLAVTLNGLEAGTCVALACDRLPAGAALPPLAGRHAAVGDPVRLLETWTFDGWRRCALAGPCATQSATPDGGTNTIEVETTLFGAAGHGPARTLQVTARSGRTTLDAVRLAIVGDAWDGTATGPAGVLTVLSVRRVGSFAWTARVRLAAPDRLDGQPGALPARPVTVASRLGTAAGTLTLDLAAPPPPGPVYGLRGSVLGTVLRWRSAADAACD